MATEIQLSTLRYPKQIKLTLQQQFAKTPLWAIFLLAGVMVIYGHSLLPVGTLKGIGYVLYTVTTAAFLIISIRWNRLNAFSPWHFLATGIFINVLADSLWYTYRIAVIDLPYPSYIDWIYLSGYVVRSVAMHLMNQARTRHQDLSGWIDSLIIGCGAGLISWIYLMEPYADNPSLTYLERAVSIAYPLMDVLMLAVVARLWITPGRRPPAYFILSIGLSLWMVADVIYAKAILDGSYYSGHLLDAVWLLSSTLMATAALHPSMRQMVEPGPQIEIKVTWQRLPLLAGMLLLSPAALIIQTIRNIPINLPVIAGGSAILFLLVVVRMSGLMTLLGRAMAREHALKNAAAAFVAKSSRESIYSTAFQAIARLADKNAVDIYLLVGLSNECALVASYQDQQEIMPPSPRPVPPLPADLLQTLKQGNIESYDYGKYASFWQAVGIERDQEEILIAPIGVQQRLLAALLVTSKQRLISEVKGGIEGLSDQVALALESLDLTENLHRQRSEARFRSLVQHGSEIIIILDAQGTIRYVSPAVERLLGYQPETLIGANLSQQMIHPKDLASSMTFQEMLVSTQDKTLTTEMLMQHSNGSWLHFEMIGSNLLHDANIQGLLITSRDISERKVFEQQLQHQAFHDPLTELPNRALFMNRLQHALIRAGRHTPNDLLALLFVDLDLFKVVNDSLGHEAGDRLLVAVANRLQRAIRPQDTVARFGGDEFMILLEDLPDEATARAIAEEMLQKLRVTENINGYEIVVTASIGVALNYAGINSTSDLLRYADAAMYQAKREGKGRYHVFDGRTSTSLLERLELLDFCDGGDRKGVKKEKMR